MTRSNRNKFLLIIVLVSMCVILISSFDIRVSNQYYDTNNHPLTTMTFEDDSFALLNVSVIYISGCLPWGMCQDQ
jgi:uncharacterized membrane protein YhaH (DUF805 family)